MIFYVTFQILLTLIFINLNNNFHSKSIYSQCRQQWFNSLKLSKSWCTHNFLIHSPSAFWFFLLTINLSFNFNRLLRVSSNSLIFYSNVINACAARELNGKIILNWKLFWAFRFFLFLSFFKKVKIKLNNFQIFL